MIPMLKKEGSAPVPAADEYRELVCRILASQTFARSERLSSFLSYISDLTLNGRAGEINEQRIGEAVFGRPPGYDSMIDGIVRTQASRLRQRLDRYFNTEGAQETVRMSVPKGGYVPLFEERTRPAISGPTLAEAPPTADGGATADLPRTRASRGKWAAFLSILAAAVLLAVAAWLWRGRAISRPGAQSAATGVDPFWSQIFNPRQTTLEVPGDSSLVIWEGLTNRNMDLADYLTGTYRTVLPGDGHASEDLAARLSQGRYTSIVDLEIAAALGRIAQAQGGSMKIRYARDVRPNDLKDANAVLVGDSEATPWDTLFEQNMNFVFSFDRGTEVNSVVNRNPRGDEAHRWEFKGSDKQHRVYAVVAFVSNLSGDGNVLILEGTSMAGTECAWDFVSDDSQLLNFLDSIRRPNGTIPHFEVVLGSNNMSGSSVRATILAWRTDR